MIGDGGTSVAVTELDAVFVVGGLYPGNEAVEWICVVQHVIKVPRRTS